MLQKELCKLGNLEQKGQCASRNFVGTVQSKWSFKYVVSRNGWSSANFYNVDNTGRPYESAPEEKYVSKYLDVSNYAKYPFGFGLSYSHFSYQPIQLSALTFTKEQPVTVSVLVRNNSPIAGEETVQFYVRDLVGQVVRPIKELKDFQKFGWNQRKKRSSVSSFRGYGALCSFRQSGNQ